ncbi:HoxN/HupN/NixA family nickel/cobalt transporter [Glaciimonas sp. Gout2]|uniref:HoxN/HupN/NixA family nickel/cobalt transporter n=1 Tax=unclassified Glaciimonas TaxID=2644401 RepID=UPI002B2253C3|nr:MULTISPECIES: HoxN/HupN/NixA family nickel/cobalt transporter [unclassified Glaciimonas]MEB0010864.1 HoxN/HupN/NixA family nickel/cobalt transporter [Glaciimonas sp. Cout2]MEB0081645.1 HoxN/HupN/NixA family nickel/cobalt transporter [Glaciimonas sp. Gout2]
MFTIFKTVLSKVDRRLRIKLFGIYGFLLVFNIVAWGWAIIAFQVRPVLLGSAFLAYSFGLRHAVDADHIAAIDNVTRKLMQEGKRPVAVGFFFSLGHSTVVLLASIAIAATASALTGEMEEFKVIGSIIGKLISAFFLIIIGIINLMVFRSIYKVFKHLRNGGEYVEEDINHLLNNRGFLAKIFRPMFAMISRSWHMYPLGFLFGLGFDTATEIGLLGIAATQASNGIPIWSILIFPLLFAAGMSLVDTLDSTLMLGIYGWAFVKPIRKLYYNMTITLVSVFVALAIGGIEVLGLISEKLVLEGKFWNFINTLTGNFGSLGYAIIAFFIFSWMASIAFYRWRGYDNLAPEQSSQ